MSLVDATALSGSAVFNSQLIPVAPSKAMYPPAALQPIMGQGSFPQNLPGTGNMIGGATSGTSAALTGATGGGASAEGGIAGAATDFSKLPLWKQPVFLTLSLLVIGYLLLRYVHFA